MPKSNRDTEPDIHIELHDYIPHGKFQRGRMRLRFSGKDANTQFINAIGRIMMDRLPTYAYARELIKVSRIDPESGYRDSIAMNHDMITLGLKNIPVQNVDPGFHYLHEKYWKGVDYLDDKREIHEEEKRIEINIDARNPAEEMDIESLLPVTTNDMQIYIDSQEVKLYDNDFPFLLLKLKSREQIRLSARAVLGVGMRDACWQAASNYSIDDETFEKAGDVIFMFKAVQVNEYILMERALTYFKERVEFISNMMEKKYLLEEEKTGTFVAMIDGEDYTICTPLAYEIQSHSDILMASSGMPDHLVDQVRIEIVTDDPDSIVKVIRESTSNLVAKIDAVSSQFKKVREITYDNYFDTDGKSRFYDFDEVREEDPTKSDDTPDRSIKKESIKKKSIKSKSTKQ